MKLALRPWIVAWLIFLLFLVSPVPPAVAAQGAASALPREEAPLQRFVCNKGYSLEKCDKDMAVLRKALAKYPSEKLGTWTWVLVRSTDWSGIFARRGRNPDSPAFTYLPKRETFIEEALVGRAGVGDRRRELLDKWQMNMSDLLDLAIAHEFGHALCNERDEYKTRSLARLLQEGKVPSCGPILEARKQTGKIAK